MTCLIVSCALWQNGHSKSEYSTIVTFASSRFNDGSVIASASMSGKAFALSIVALPVALKPNPAVNIEITRNKASTPIKA